MKKLVSRMSTFLVAGAIAIAAAGVVMASSGSSVSVELDVTNGTSRSVSAEVITSTVVYFNPALGAGVTDKTNVTEPSGVSIAWTAFFGGGTSCSASAVNATKVGVIYYSSGSTTGCSISFSYQTPPPPPKPVLTTRGWNQTSLGAVVVETVSQDGSQVGQQSERAPAHSALPPMQITLKDYSRVRIDGEFAIGTSSGTPTSVILCPTKYLNVTNTKPTAWISLHESSGKYVCSIE